MELPNMLRGTVNNINLKRTITNLSKELIIPTDYQFIQRSLVPTLHFQKSLPRLPIPKLPVTCQRYLDAQRPLLVGEAYEKTVCNTDRFQNMVGKRLQEQLVAYDKNNKHTSYISEMWFDMYLRDRKPIPVNYNPMIVMTNPQNKAYSDQLIRATNLIISSLRFYKSLKAGILEPEVFHINPKKSDTTYFRKICASVPANISWYAAYLFNAYPLDMSQYPNLFNATRIPETDKDRIVISKGNHIMVQHKGHIYAVRVLDDNGDIYPREQILARLKFILNDDVEACQFPVGILTAMERNKWATVRHHLAEHGNKDQLKLIDSALLNLVLDSDESTEDPRKVTQKFLHGGIDGNRWFDKSISLIVAKDGVAGINFEHSWGDGVAVLRYIQDIYKDTEENPMVHPDTVPKDTGDHQVARLDFALSDGLKKTITEAQADYEKVFKSINVDYLVFDGLGKQLCKKHGVSSDSIMQMAFQAAYHKLTSKFVASYESCSTAAFKHGRTETIRPCTIATKEFSIGLNSATKPSNEVLKQMIVECSRVHNQLTREAAMGQGFDRHLFALKKFAEKESIQSNIFEDPSYASINYNIISTSTLNSPAVYAGGFGPVVKDGLGLGYVIKEDFSGVLLTTYDGCQDGAAFIDALNATFSEIVKILEA